MTDPRAALADLTAAEHLTEAMDFDRVEAQAIIRKHGFVFARRLDQVTDDSEEAARWEKLAFTLYTMLLPSNRRSEKIAAALAECGVLLVTEEMVNFALQGTTIPWGTRTPTEEDRVEWVAIILDRLRNYDAYAALDSGRHHRSRVEREMRDPEYRAAYEAERSALSGEATE